MNHFSVNAVTNLVNDWYAIANQDAHATVSTTEERMNLYKNTESIAQQLRQMHANIQHYEQAGNSHTAQAVKQKIQLLAQGVLAAFNSHNVQENTQLANWVCSHTLYKSESTEVEGGAYPSLHHLFQSLLVSTEQTVQAPEMWAIAFIDAAALEYSNRPNFSGVFNLPLDIQASLPANKLLTLREQEQHKVPAELALIQQINQNGPDGMLFSQLGLTSLEKIIGGFGANCNRFAHLTLSEFNTRSKTAASDNARLISNHFRNLSTLNLDFGKISPNDCLKMDELILPNLTQMTISYGGNKYIRIDFNLDKFPQLTTLKTDGILALSVERNENSKVESNVKIICHNNFFVILSNLQIKELICPKTETIFLIRIKIDSDLFVDKHAIKTLRLSSVEGLNNINFLKLPNLQGFHLSNCDEDKPDNNRVDFSECSARAVSLSYCNFRTLNFQNTNLEDLDLSYNKNIFSIEINNKIKLKEFRLLKYPNSKVESFNFLNNMKTVKILSLPKNSPAFIVSELFPELEDLSVHVSTLNKIQGLENCKTLHILQLLGPGEISLEFIEKIPAGLKVLKLFDKRIVLSQAVREAFEKRGIEIELIESSSEPAAD
jgi:hypothetical protein